MPPRKYQEPMQKPIDRVIESLEFQACQIADLINMMQDQEKRLKVLENKMKVREQLEKERAEESKGGWFF